MRLRHLVVYLAVLGLLALELGPINLELLVGVVDGRNLVLGGFRRLTRRGEVLHVRRKDEGGAGRNLRLGGLRLGAA